MATTASIPDQELLERFNIDKDTRLMDDLVIALLFGNDKSKEQIAKAIAFRRPNGHGLILPNDIAHIFSFLAANPGYNNNTYTKWKKVQENDEYGDRDEEVQRSLRDWVADIERVENDENAEDASSLGWCIGGC